MLSNERTRILEGLKNASYYSATKELVRFEVDSTITSDSASGGHGLTVKTILQIPANGKLQKYRIDKVYIYPTN